MCCSVIEDRKTTIKIFDQANPSKRNVLENTTFEFDLGKFFI